MKTEQNHRDSGVCAEESTKSRRRWEGREEERKMENEDGMRENRKTTRR